MTSKYNITPYYEARTAIEMGAENYQKWYIENKKGAIGYLNALILALKEYDLELYKYVDEKMNLQSVLNEKMWQKEEKEQFFKNVRFYYVDKCGLYLVSLNGSKDIKNGGEVVIIAYIDAVEGFVSEFKGRTYLLREVTVLNDKIDPRSLLNEPIKINNDSKGV